MPRELQVQILQVESPDADIDPPLGGERRDKPLEGFVAIVEDGSCGAPAGMTPERVDRKMFVDKTARNLGRKRDPADARFERFELSLDQEPALAQDDDSIGDPFDVAQNVR